MDDLNRTIDAASIAVDATPEDHPNRAATLGKLGNWLGARFQRTGSMDDLNRTIDVANIVVDATPQDHPNRVAILSNLVHWLGIRFERTRSMDDFNRTIDVADMIVDATPEDHPNRAATLSKLGNWLDARFQQTGSMDDLNRAIDVTDLAVDAIPKDHPDRAAMLNNLGVWLGARFERTESTNDLNRAVDVTDMAVDATSKDHPDRAGRLSSLGNWLGTRFERTGSMDDLNRAIDVTDMAVGATPKDHPDRAMYLNNLGNWLGTRFDQTGSTDDLNRAVDVANMAVDATPQDHPDRASRLSNLGTRLGRRFEWTGSMDDLSRAVDVANMAVDATLKDHPDRTAILNNLGAWLGTRFERTGSMDDLNRAIDVTNMAVDATPKGHSNRAGQLSNLGAWFGTRFERTGSMDDLNRALDTVNLALDVTPQDHPNRVATLSNLGHWLGVRFERTGSMDYLNRAIDVTNTAVDATPRDHPDRAMYLNNLGNWLGTRFDRTGSMDDLNRAVDVANLAVGATPQDHPNRASRLNNLGNRLGKRFKRTGSMDDLNRAVDVANMAVDATPRNHPDRAVYLNNLGNWLGTRFDRTGSMDDLNRAVDAANMAVDTTPQGQPDRAGWFLNLGNWLSKRFEQIGSMDDIDHALLSYKGGWHCRTAPPSIRIRSARKAAQILASRLIWEDASILLQEAVKLLPTISPRSLKHTDKQYMLADFGGLASMAAAAALNAGRDAYSALRLLELGRGVIASLLMDMRGDISDLMRDHPGLADEFTLLRDELDSPMDASILSNSDNTTSSWELQAKRRRDADQRFSELIIQIRSKPGFDNFLHPPTADELTAAANPDHVVVVNVSSYRCDAFLVERNRIRVVELPALKLAEVQQRALGLRLSRPISSSHMASLLEWLWDIAAGPCLDALGFKDAISDDDWHRVWWIPTGLLSQLPLHAAGRYTQGSTETVLDRVMSSYTSSVKALVHGRRQHTRNSRGPTSDRALLIAMRETPGLIGDGTLQYAAAEIEMLNGICPSLKLQPITPALRKDEVINHLQDCRIFHFAGHGRSDPTEPSQSCLLLQDWETNPLTVGDLRDRRLQENPPFLAYLSACSTGANDAVELADEGVHLVSAFQLAGFRHAIGTLWEVSDMHCVDVARVFYETLRDEGMTDSAVCRGLHRAIRALRAATGPYREGNRTRVADLNYDTQEATKTSDDDEIAKNDHGSAMYQTQSASESGVTTESTMQTRIERDPGRVKRRKGQEMVWVPYIHFGV